MQKRPQWLTLFRRVTRQTHRIFCFHHLRMVHGANLARPYRGLSSTDSGSNMTILCTSRELKSHIAAEFYSTPNCYVCQPTRSTSHKLMNQSINHVRLWSSSRLRIKKFTKVELRFCFHSDSATTFFQTRKPVERIELQKCEKDRTPPIMPMMMLCCPRRVRNPLIGSWKNLFLTCSELLSRR